MAFSYGPGVLFDLTRSATADPEAVVLAAAWAAAIAVAAWYLAGTAVCLLARARPDAPALQALARRAPALVRRAAGVACSVSIVLAPATAHAAAPDRPAVGAVTGDRGDEPVVRTPPAVRDGRARSTAPEHNTVPTNGTTPPTSSTTGAESAEAGSPRPPTAAASDAASPAPAPPSTGSPAPRATTYVIRPGDNLWSIASVHVARATGVDVPEAAAVVPYWRALIDANRVTLRSGDPSLVFPGEAIALPPLG